MFHETDFAVSMPFGIALVIGALLMHTPMTPLVLCMSSTFLLTPLLYFSEQRGLLGMVGRQWGVAPYLALALVGIWMR